MKRYSKIMIHVVLIVGLLISLMPFLWMLATSLKEPGEVMLYPPKWVPAIFQWKNYVEIWNIIPLGTFIKNTVIVTIMCMIGELVTASMVAFAFARLRFRGKNFLFWLVLSSMMLPGQVTMIPIFILFKTLGWVDTLKPLILPSFLGGGAFYIFLLRQFFTSIPKELDEAAKIDGCSPLRIYWHIILPLSKPALATVAVFSFIAHWNDFMTPLIYLNSIEKQTLAIGLKWFQGQYGTNYHLLMAAATLALIPVMIIFFVAQKYFVRGISMTGLKT